MNWNRFYLSKSTFTCAVVLIAMSSYLEPGTDVSCPGKASDPLRTHARSESEGMVKNFGLVTLPLELQTCSFVLRWIEFAVLFGLSNHIFL